MQASGWFQGQAPFSHRGYQLIHYFNIFFFIVPQAYASTRYRLFQACSLCVFCAHKWWSNFCKISFQLLKNISRLFRIIHCVFPLSILSHSSTKVCTFWKYPFCSSIRKFCSFSFFVFFIHQCNCSLPPVHTTNPSCFVYILFAVAHIDKYVILRMEGASPLPDNNQGINLFCNWHITPHHSLKSISSA